ncbi:hypothetical protein [Ruminococcus callidus]|uniref:hypothetical protein n=1 Tax=Ruminococcus callidus TaxID=40519 RepID=UPI003521691A
MNFIKKRKWVLFIAFFLLFICILLLCKIESNMQKESKQLNLQNISSIEILISKDYETKERVVIVDETAIEQFMNYFNSIELVEVDSGPLIDLPYECIYVYIQGGSRGSIGSISVWENYLTTWEQDVDDCMSIKYRMVHSGFNYITGESDVSIFLKELINDYTDQ